VLVQTLQVQVPCRVTAGGGGGGWVLRMPQISATHRRLPSNALVPVSLTNASAYRPLSAFKTQVFSSERSQLVSSGVC